MTLTEQMNNVCAAGFVEVKGPESDNHHYNTHKDNYRLAMFCKEAVDRRDIKCAIGIQAVDECIFVCSRSDCDSGLLTKDIE